MIIIRLWGGIGNQLFEYAFGRYIENMLDIDVRYDSSSFGCSDTKRKLEISYVFPHIKIKNISFSRYNGLVNRVLRFIFQIKNTFVSERDFKVAVLSKFKGDLYLEGYWQNDVYANSIVEDELILNWETPLALQEFKNKIISSDRSVSIHVRRGDYFSSRNVNIYGVCDETYYINAIKKVESVFNDKIQIFVFSDDLNWVRQHVQLPEDAIFIPNYNDIPQFSYVNLMSLCKANIISNSSFSWWGTFLNRNIGKIVIAPERWTNTSPNTIALDSWIKL